MPAGMIESSRASAKFLSRRLIIAPLLLKDVQDEVNHITTAEMDHYISGDCHHDATMMVHQRVSKRRTTKDLLTFGY
jgi:hypothetical protein